jgi:hypothetical protein
MKPLRDDEPREIGPYRLLAELGEGGMGRVLLAVGGDGRLVALKVMRRHLLNDDRFRFRFRREVITSREVAASRWTAAVVAADEDAAEPWLASEFFHGPTAAEAIAANGPFDEDAGRRLVHGLAAALAEIHAIGVVHRDLKPSNVILTEDGVRIIDFGIARTPGGSGADTTITETGALIGAPAYMSPEQITMRPVGPETDVFSLGTTAITAATGANPFEAEALFEVMNRVVHGEPDLGGIPGGLRALIEPCMAKDPAARVTAADLLARIGTPLAGPWPPAVAALDEQQRGEVAELARRNGWDTAVRPDRTAVMYGPGFVDAATWIPDGTTVSGPPYTGGGYPPPPGGGGAAVPPGPVPPPANPDRQPLYAVLTAAAVVAIAAFLILVIGDDGEDDPESGSGTDDPWATTGDYDYDYEEDTYDYETDPAAETTAEYDPIADAAVGDCFYDYGTETEADLESTSCTDGAFEVVDIYYGTTDLDSCDGVDDLSTSVSSAANDMVLCLSYLYSWGDAYHADPGECVFGSPGEDSYWETIECQTGAFEVLERLTGVADDSGCTESTYYNHSVWFTTSESYLDVTLCMRMIYPDDIGYAGQNDCLSMSGDPDAGTAYYEFSDCDAANVYVTGRTDEYDAAWFCGDDGWASWQSGDFPEHAYTVCWRWL